MTRGVTTGGVTRAELIKRLKLDKNDKTKLLQLLIMADSKKLVTKSEIALSVPTTTSTIKSYLYTLVENVVYRDKIESYVKVASQLFIRGSYIANLVAENLLGEIISSNEKYRPNVDATQPFYDLINGTNSTFKHCFLPERWPSRKEAS